MAASDGQSIAQVSSRFRALTQVARSPGLSLARRKSAASRSDTTPIERRTILNGHRATDNSDAGAVRRGERLAGRG
jgi:hypothetical protein